MTFLFFFDSKKSFSFNGTNNFEVLTRFFLNQGWFKVQTLFQKNTVFWLTVSTSCCLLSDVCNYYFCFLWTRTTYRTTSRLSLHFCASFRKNSLESLLKFQSKIITTINLCEIHSKQQKLSLIFINSTSKIIRHSQSDLRHIQYISFTGIFLETFNKINCVNKTVENSFCLVTQKCCENEVFWWVTDSNYRFQVGFFIVSFRLIISFNWLNPRALKALNIQIIEFKKNSNIQKNRIFKTLKCNQRKYCLG